MDQRRLEEKRKEEELGEKAAREFEKNMLDEK
jgi:hypothetical protein